MTREEILEKSRKDNKNMDEMEKTVDARSGNIAGACCVILALLIGTVNVLSGGPRVLDDSMTAVMFCYLAVNQGLQARILRRKIYWFLCTGYTLISVYKTISVIISLLS